MRPLRCTWLSQSTDMERLRFEVFLDPDLGSFATQAGLLDTPEWRHFRRHHAGVEADHARLERLCDAPGALQVSGVEISRESEWGCICDGDRLLVGVETEE